MDHLRDYPTMAQLRASWTQLKQLGNQTGEGMGLPGIARLQSPEQQARTDVDAARRSVLKGVQSDYMAAKGEIESARTEMDTIIADATKKLGTADEFAERAFNELASGWDTVIVSGITYEPPEDATEEDFEGMYQDRYDGRWYYTPTEAEAEDPDFSPTPASWEREDTYRIAREHMADFNEKYGYGAEDIYNITQDPETFEWHVREGENPHTEHYLDEARDWMSSYEDDVKAELYPAAYEEWAKAMATLGGAGSEGYQTLLGHESDLMAQGRQLGVTHANLHMSLEDEMEGTAVEEAYEGRRKERQEGFSVLSRGSGVMKGNEGVNNE